MAMPEGVQAGTAGSRTFLPKQNGGIRLGLWPFAVVPMCVPHACGAFDFAARVGKHENQAVRDLVAESRADGDALAAGRAAAAQHGCAALGLHTRTKAVSLDAAAAIRLKCALGHESALLFPLENLRLDGKI